MTSWHAGSFTGSVDSRDPQLGLHLFLHLPGRGSNAKFLHAARRVVAGWSAVVTVAGRYPDTHSNTDANAFTDPDTGPDRSRPVAERLYQVGRGNRR